MKEVFKMWKYTKMVVLVALSAGIYAAVLIPFKGFVIIPGITEFRPASALPVVLGLLFGPAGAWGAAIGNLIGDFFGSLGIGSLFGFVGNFMFAYIPYKIWTNLVVAKDENKEPEVKGGKKIFGYILAAILGSAACALIIGWGLELLGMVPFAALGSIITLNNSIPSIVLGLPLIMVLYPRIKKWDLLWTDILNEEDLPPTGARAKIGATIAVVSILFGMIVGLGTAFGMGQAAFSFESAAGNMGVIITAGIGSIGIIVSMLFD